jgi:hypothetical protein
LPYPQHATAPELRAAQEYWMPAATVTASVIPATDIGVSLFELVPFPSAPYSPLPQQATLPVLRTAQVWYLPAAIATASLSPWTVTGVLRLVVVASPSSPWKL